MIDHQLAALAVEQLSPEAAQAAQTEAKRRGVSVADVVLDENIAAHQALTTQLFAMRSAPAMRVIEGGRA